METININKTLNFENGSIEFRYTGITLKKDIDQNKIHKLLDNFIEHHNHDDMLKNVAFLRTILKDYEEKILVIYYEDDKGLELVKYDNSNLFLFEKSKKAVGGKFENLYKIKYEPPYGINLDYKTEITDYEHTELISEELNEIMHYIYQLKDIHAIELNHDSKALIEIYKLFYSENPNFSDENINTKVQSMMSILAQFGISLGDDYHFTSLPNIKFPSSLYLNYLVKKLYPFGEVTFVVDPVKLADKPTKIIKIVGECVREMINEEYNKEEALVMISQIIYAARYNLSTNSNIDEICEFAHRTSDEVESSIRLVKSIESQISQQIQ